MMVQNGANAKDSLAKKTILLKLNQDGTFKQCDEGYTEGKWISGNWQLVEDLSGLSKDQTKSKTSHKLVLAMNRQYYGPQFDVVLDGCLEMNDNDEKSIISNEKKPSSKDEPVIHPTPLCFHGSVHKGKYLHPRGHTSFFDPPFLASPETVGTFHLEQSLAAFSIRGDPDAVGSRKNDVSDVTIHNSDFHHKKFIMTIEPLQQSKTRAQQTTHQPVDIRSMPVTFFANNTFCAMGTNKILRGRYQVRGSGETSDEDNPLFELSMAVSLFGAGRSAPGSVYSEGLGLTHEDERTYIGAIQQQILNNYDQRFYVQGTVFFGTDLEEDARPEPVASFYLIEDIAKSLAAGSQVLSGSQAVEANAADDEAQDLPFGVFE
jgi:hypothetical protein